MAATMIRQDDGCTRWTAQSGPELWPQWAGDGRKHAQRCSRV